MRLVNATVHEFGRSPYPAEYRATRISDGKYYMEIRYGKQQSRKWVQPKYVTFKTKVTERFIEKVSELSGQEV